MPQFVRFGDFFGVSYVTGPSHVHLRIKFGGARQTRPRMVHLPAFNKYAEQKLTAELVRDSVLAGIQAANLELGSAYVPASIAFVPDDSPRYDIFQHCAVLIVRRIQEKGDFELPSITPYTNEELKLIENETLPSRGEICPKCDTPIPQFADLGDEDRFRILKLISQSQNALAIKELRASVGCSLRWAKIWVVHSGRPDVAGTTAPCPYCGMPLITARARQCQHCNMDWHDPANPIKLGS